MKIIFMTLLTTQLLQAELPPRSLTSLSTYLESHDLAGVGNTKHCFASYLPKLELVGASWSREYNDCQQQASMVQSNVLSRVVSMQQAIRTEALRIGTYIESCLNITDVLDYFSCFAKLSKQQLVSMYTISVNASEIALSLNQELNSVDVQRYICTNRTEESYVLGTARIFDALDKCLEHSANLAKSTD